LCLEKRKRREDFSMKSIIKRISAHSSKNIVVVGSIILDEYIYGGADRVSREAPVLVFKKERTIHCCGGAANTILNVAAAGWQVTPVGVLGSDAAAQKIISLLQEKKISTDFLRQSPVRKTAEKARVICHNQQLLRIDQEHEVIQLTAAESEHIIASVDKALEPGGMLIISDYGDGFADRMLVAELRRCAHERHATILVDPRGPDLLAYRGVDIIKPNYGEFLAMAACCGITSVTDQNFEEVAQRVRAEFEVTTLIITLGSKGMVAVTAEGIMAEPAYQHKVHDITGAGDTACGYLALGFAAGCSIAETLRLASAACAISVIHDKNYPVALDEVAAFCTQKRGASVVQTWDEVHDIVTQKRAQGKKIVFTNGCFDILHAGHISLLQQARQEGDFLIVALNTDASVQKLKGPTRPVNSLSDRMQVIGALEAVDLVCSFSQETPEQLMALLQPDVVVKGGDYQAHLLPGYDLVTGYGGQFKIIDFVEGRSTTNIVRAVQECGEDFQGVLSL
jgi:D-beta-D-heptose 7-phosphate kinase/D-beta-D-heptose 1-phosphate adenosyltransferase